MRNVLKGICRLVRCAIVFVSIFIVNNINSQNTISGMVFLDADNNQSMNGDDIGVGAISIMLYEDLNENGALEGSDNLIDSVITDEDGSYSFTVSAVPSDSINVQVNSSADDADEKTLLSGSMSVTSTSLEIEPGRDDGEISAVRFQNLAIPQGSQIVTAYIIFTAKQNEGDAQANWVIYGEDVDDATAFSSSAYDISSRTSTSDSVLWTGEEAWLTDQTYNTPNIATVVEEIVGRPGWNMGNDMVLVVSGGASPTGQRRAHTYNSSTSKAPRLVVITQGGNSDSSMYVMEVQTEGLGSGAFLTSDAYETAVFTGDNQTDINNDFGYIGSIPNCYAVADGGDYLYLINRYTGKNIYIGDVGVSNLETIALNGTGDTLFTVNDNVSTGEFGFIDLLTGAFTDFAGNLGQGTGALGTQTFIDVDGMAFDRINNILYGVLRRTGDDLLFQINTGNGTIVQDAFGANTDYVVISGTGVNDAIDDLAFNPVDTTLWASVNGPQLIKINPTNGAATLISTFNMEDMEGLTMSLDGVLYGTTGASTDSAQWHDSFWEIDQTNGDVRQIAMFNGGSDYEACDCQTSIDINLTHGIVFSDSDDDGIVDEGETGTSGVKVYLFDDINGDGILDGGDVIIDSATTNANGGYSFTHTSSGEFLTALDVSTLPSGHDLTTDNEEVSQFQTLGMTNGNRNFGHNVSLLPVTLVDFHAQAVGMKEVEVLWGTMTESNCDIFEVQRSINGINFHTIDWTFGAGNSVEERKYGIMDQNPSKGLNYYRLKQIDYSGESNYSHIVSVNLSSQTPTIKSRVYPNPVSDFLVIELEGDNLMQTKLHLFNIEGKHLKSIIMHKSSGVLDMRNLENGWYFIKSSENEEIQFKVLKSE